MNVGTKPLVISQVPAIVVGVFIDDDRVAIPEPTVGVVVVVGGDAKVEPVEPETVSASSLQPEDVSTAEASGEPSVLKGMIDVIMRIVPAGIMSNPFVVRVNVGRFRMAGLVGKSAVLWGTAFRGLRRTAFRSRMRLHPRRRWAMSRDVSAANLAAPASTMSAAPLVRENRD